MKEILWPFDVCGNGPDGRYVARLKISEWSAICLHGDKLSKRGREVELQVATVDVGGDMAFWYNMNTGEVAESTEPPFDASERMGPYDTKDAAKNAYLTAAVRNADADISEKAWKTAGEDDFDRDQRKWKEAWDK